MPAIRAALVVFCLGLFFVLALPAQWLAADGSRLANLMTRLFCRTLLGVLRVRVIGPGPGRDTRPRLLVANHVSWLDILVLGSTEPLCFLAKREVGTWPVIAAFARQSGTIFVDRRRRRDIPRANAVMARRLAEGRSVVLFPEGTTYDGSVRGPFLTSHLACLRDQMNLPPGVGRCLVQPVGLHYSDPAAAWIGDDSLVPHLWRLLRGGPVTCTLSYGAMQEVSCGFDRKVLGRYLRGEVDALLSGVVAGSGALGERAAPDPHRRADAAALQAS